MPVPISLRRSVTTGTHRPRMQTHFGCWRSGDGWLDGTRRGGAVKLREGARQRRALRVGRWSHHAGRFKHGRVADPAGRAGTGVVAVPAAGPGAVRGAMAGHDGGPVLERLPVVVVMVAAMVVIVAGRRHIHDCGAEFLLCRRCPARTAHCIGRREPMARSCVRMDCGLVHGLKGCRHRHAGGHGATHQASKDQDHHEHEVKAATHPSMIRERHAALRSLAQAVLGVLAIREDVFLHGVLPRPCTK